MKVHLSNNCKSVNTVNCNYYKSVSDLKYLREILPPSTEEEFFDYLASITTKDIVVYAIDEGTAVFPKVPLLQLEGPLPIVQMLETTLLNLINYARYT